MTLAASDVIDDWLELRQQGYRTYAAAAERLGLKPKALEHIVRRARTAGDKRVPANLRDTRTPTYDGIDLAASMETRATVPARDAQRAVRYVAGAARDVDDLADLLAKLGLDPKAGRR